MVLPPPPSRGQTLDVEPSCCVQDLQQPNSPATDTPDLYQPRHILIVRHTHGWLAAATNAKAAVHQAASPSRCMQPTSAAGVLTHVPCTQQQTAQCCSQPLQVADHLPNASTEAAQRPTTAQVTQICHVQCMLMITYAQHHAQRCQMLLLQSEAGTLAHQILGAAALRATTSASARWVPANTGASPAAAGRKHRH